MFCPTLLEAPINSEEKQYHLASCQIVAVSGWALALLTGVEVDAIFVGLGICISPSSIGSTCHRTLRYEFVPCLVQHLCCRICPPAWQLYRYSHLSPSVYLMLAPRYQLQLCKVDATLVETRRLRGSNSTLHHLSLFSRSVTARFNGQRRHGAEAKPSLDGRVLRKYIVGRHPIRDPIVRDSGE